MNSGLSPSAPPRGVRQGMSIAAIRSRGLTRHSNDELEFLRRLICGQADSARLAHCAPRCWTITSGGGPR